MRGLLNSIGNSILTILVILLICYGWAFIETKILLKPNPELFGYVFFQQDNDDMATDFYTDDVLLIKKNDTYRMGDRIFYLDSDSKYKVQTVVSTDEISTVTKCNTCVKNSKPIDNSQVIGRVIGKIAFVGKFITFFKQKWLLVTIGVIGFICVVVGEYYDNRPKKKVASN